MTVLKQITAIVLTLDKPTEHTGRIYPKDVVQKALDAAVPNVAKIGCIAPKDGWDTNIRFQGVIDFSHTASPYIEGDSLMADIKVYDTPDGATLFELLEAGLFDQKIMYFGPSFIGTVDENKVVTTIDRIVGIDAYKNEADNG